MDSLGFIDNRVLLGSQYISDIAMQVTPVEFETAIEKGKLGEDLLRTRIRLCVHACFCMNDTSEIYLYLCVDGIRVNGLRGRFVHIKLL